MGRLMKLADCHGTSARSEPRPPGGGKDEAVRYDGGVKAMAMRVPIDYDPNALAAVNARRVATEPSLTLR